MNDLAFKLSPKYIDYINTVKNVDAEFLEGQTAAGKTTIAASIKFMRLVSESPRKLHIIASRTTGTAEKNIINQDNGILDFHHNAIYNGRGDVKNKLPHIKFEDKLIYVLGYDSRDKWENVLGGQYGIVLLDEINTADIEFVREISSRNDYLIGTLNPDDPRLPIYNEFINHSRPYSKYAADVPAEIMQELNQCEPKKNWRYWFFLMDDNAGLTPEAIEKKRNSVPKGTKIYKNKILGLRGKATGLVFSNFEHSKHVITKEQAKEKKYIGFSAGLDTAYSSQSNDTIAMIFTGITEDRELIVLDERVYNNKELTTPIAPSDTAKNFFDFLERNRDEWGLARNVFIDSADQATITEINKYKRSNPCVYTFNNAYKKLKIIDRINLVLGWLHTGHYLVVNTCVNHITELDVYSWLEDKDNTPEDGNDHTINAVQYAFIPYKSRIGLDTGEE
jgi:PBSX family phage terminase large subunit